jgi:hypothetical protein
MNDLDDTILDDDTVQINEDRYRTLRGFKGRNVKFDDKKKAEFLIILNDTFNVSEAVQGVGVSSATVYSARKSDPDFAAAWDDVIEFGTDELIAEGRRRAYEGVDEPVFHQGRVVGHKKRFSDQLLMFLVKANRPEYRDNKALELSGKEGGPIQIAVIQDEADL